MRTFHDLLPYQLAEEIEGELKDAAFWGEFHTEVGGQIDRMTSILSNLSEGTRMTSTSAKASTSRRPCVRPADWSSKGGPTSASASSPRPTCRP